MSRWLQWHAVQETEVPEVPEVPEVTGTATFDTFGTSHGRYTENFNREEKKKKKLSVYKDNSAKSAKTPAKVICIRCREFVPDPIGCGGIGTCRVAGEGSRHPAKPLFPRAERECRDWREARDHLPKTGLRERQTTVPPISGCLSMK